MISYDFNNHSLNGKSVAYCALPFHAIEAAFSHKQLTQTAKNAYIALLSYAAYKNKLTFNITVTWVAEKLAVTRKTAGTALAQLKEFGFANDTGIVIPSTDKVAKSKAANTQPKPKPEQDSVNCENPEQPSIEEQVETFIKAGFSRDKAEKMVLRVLEATKNKQENFTQSVSKKYPHNNTPKVTTQDNLPKQPSNIQPESHFAATNYKDKGQLSSSANARCVKKQDDNSVVAQITKQIKYLNGEKKIRNTKSYVFKSLQRMTVKSNSELERYYNEIIYSIERGFIRSIDAALWLIENGRWKHPSGQYQ
jgi:hypothetical protein